MGILSAVIATVADVSIEYMPIKAVLLICE